MAAQTAPVPEENAEEIIDLTELIERGDAASAPEAAADLGGGTGNEDAEIEALLAQMDASDGASFSAQAPPPGSHNPTDHVVDPNEKLDMSDMGDIDDLLASLDIPAQPHPVAPDASPEPPAPAAQPSPGMGADLSQDLDAAMNELLAGAAPKATAPPQPKAAAPKPAAAKPTAPKAAAPEPAPPKAAAPEPEDILPGPAPDAMLQDLDAAMAELLNPAPTPPAATPAAPADAPSVEDLLAAASVPPAPKASAEAEMEADLDALLDDTALAAPAQGAESSGLEADIASLLTSLDAETAPEAPAPDQPAPEANMSAASATVAEEASFSVEGLVSEAALEAPLDASPDASFGASPDAAPDALLDAPLDAPLDATPADEAAPDMDPLLVEITAQTAAMPDAQVDPEAAEPLDLEPEPPSAQAAAAAAATAAADAALLGGAEDFASLAATLGERLRQCEADLAAARSRIEALEHASADSVSLGDLLREGSPLHNGFAALIASSVGQALKDTPPPICLPEAVESRINGLETRQKSILARMDALEERLDSLEPRFNDEVGKAAASAVARILREEISRLAQG